jgi:energy-coupling factor transporter ATP-binding protein EcfA2
VVKAFRGATILDRVDLTCRWAPYIAVVGRNGAGKSTLLRILATTVVPEVGTASIAGIDVLDRPRDACTQIGLCLADERSWYWPLTGRQNLDFFGRLHGLQSPGPRGAVRAGAERRRPRRARGSLVQRLLDGMRCDFRSRARCCTTRRCCCSTSRRDRSTRRVRQRCSSSCATRQPRGRPSCSSPRPGEAAQADGATALEAGRVVALVGRAA